MPSLYLMNKGGESICPVKCTDATYRVVMLAKQQGRSTVQMRNKDGKQFDVETRDIYLCEVYAQFAYFARKILHSDKK